MLRVERRKSKSNYERQTDTSFDKRWTNCLTFATLIYRYVQCSSVTSVRLKYSGKIEKNMFLAASVSIDTASLR